MDYEINEMVTALEAELDPNVMKDDELQGIVGKEIDDAIDFIDNWISPARATATQYYRGEPFGNEEEGRSQVVSMDVRDTVQAIMPSLMRIFHGTDRTVEFVPQGPEDAASAKQATDYANYIINRDNNGFLEMHSAFMDALVRKVGILKVYWDDQTKTESYDLSGLDDAALNALMADPAAEIEIIASTPLGEPMMDPASGMIMEPPMEHAVRVSYTNRHPFPGSCVVWPTLRWAAGRAKSNRLRRYSLHEFQASLPRSRLFRCCRSRGSSPRKASADAALPPFRALRLMTL